MKSQKEMLLTQVLMKVLSLAIMPGTILSQGQPSPTQQPVQVYKNWNENNMDFYPNPLNSFPGCNRVKRSYICDPNRRILQSDADEVNSAIEALRLVNISGIGEKVMSCSGVKVPYVGLAIIVAIMENISSVGNLSVGDVMKKYAEDFAIDWTFNQCNDGIVYVIVDNRAISKCVYRHYEPATKTILEKNGCIDYIAKKGDPIICDGKIAEGLLEDMKNFNEIITGKSTCKNDDNNAAFIAIIIIVIVIAVIVAIVIAVIFIKKRQNQREVNPPTTVPDGAAVPLKTNPTA